MHCKTLKIRVQEHRTCGIAPVAAMPYDGYALRWKGSCASHLRSQLGCQLQPQLHAAQAAVLLLRDQVDVSARHALHQQVTCAGKTRDISPLLLPWAVNAAQCTAAGYAGFNPEPLTIITFLPFKR